MSDCRTLRPPSLLDGTTARRFAIAFTGTIVYTGVPHPPIMSAGGSAGSCARRSDDTEAVSAKHQACPHLAVHVHPDSTLEMGATEMGAAIGCPLVGDSTRGTETAESLTSTPASWAARLGALSERSVP